MTTVDRRAVQELIKRLAKSSSSTDAIARTAVRMFAASMLVGLAGLPSTNAQAVAWQYKYRNDDDSGWNNWEDCTKDMAEKFATSDGYLVRALCVCSGDAKEA